MSRRWKKWIASEFHGAKTFNLEVLSRVLEQNKHFYKNSTVTLLQVGKWSYQQLLYHQVLLLSVCACPPKKKLQRTYIDQTKYVCSSGHEDATVLLVISGKNSLHQLKVDHQIEVLGSRQSYISPAQDVMGKKSLGIRGWFWSEKTLTFKYNSLWHSSILDGPTSEV